MGVDNKAADYAANNTVECLRRAIEQAYKDGYWDGYHDRENEMSILENDVEFVDLGLPSKTLWAVDNVKNPQGETLYFPFCDADSYALPTEEQWEELQRYCLWHLQTESKNIKTVVCVGPNGASIQFPRTGLFIGEERVNRSDIYFWLKSEKTTESESSLENRLAANWYGYHCEGFKTIPVFAGKSIPIRLVTRRTD